MQDRAGFRVALSYPLSYHFLVAQRQKRSISLPADGVAEWERQHGALTPDELVDGLARARAMLRRQLARKSAWMDAVTYDTGALIAADRNDRHTRNVADATWSRITVETV